MRTARSAALRAPLTATVATGMPLGIWTMASSESSPPRLASATGTPITGSGVAAATTPARWAAPPAAAMMTLMPASTAPRANAMVSSGVRWAESTLTSTGIPNERRVWTASSMIDESEALPMMMATDMPAFCPTGGPRSHPCDDPSRSIPRRPRGGPVRLIENSFVAGRGPRRSYTGRNGLVGGGVTMRIGAMFNTEVPFDQMIDEVASLREAGIQTAWASQIFAYDALTAIAAVGREVPGIDFGTAVIPTYPRHPVMLAGQALTVQAATAGRLTLGIGLSHQVVIEHVFGQSFERPARHMREYLSILVPLLEGEQVTFAGETLRASTFGPLQISATAPPVLVAALGDAMLKIAGQLASGTVTWMTGPATIESHIAPTIRAAAAAAGRPEPRIGMGLPVCVTADVEAAREKASAVFAIYGQLPSYRGMLDREGAGGPADVAIVGTEAEVKAQLRRLADIGVTDFCAAPFGSADQMTASVAALASLI